ncbi:MAG: CHAD domain-containing protein [Chlorobi bacterium]|nr:CHAD domain-containing protein [Chlorobiota bacterium]
MTQIIKDYYIGHKSLFEENFLLAKETSNAGAIHKMRTSMKRLRALFQLVEVLTDGKFIAKKQLKKGRKVFKSVGDIRELQVEEMLVYEYETKLCLKFIDYSEYLIEKGQREITHLKQSPLAGDDSLFDDESFDEALNSINQEEIQLKARSFVKQKSNALIKLNEKGKTIKRIHKNRTILKQLYYLYPILIELSGWHQILGMSPETMREREQQIGNWHDRVNSLHYLNHFFDAKDGRGTDDYIELKRYIVSERDQMKDEITKHLFNIQTALWDYD